MVGVVIGGWRSAEMGADGGSSSCARLVLKSSMHSSSKPLAAPACGTCTFLALLDAFTRLLQLQSLF